MSEVLGLVTTLGNEMKNVTPLTSAEINGMSRRQRSHIAVLSLFTCLFVMQIDNLHERRIFENSAKVL